MNPDEFREAFLRANANKDTIAGELAALVRDCVRASAGNDTGMGVARASEKLVHLINLIARSKELNLYDVVSGAVEGLTVEPTDDPVDDAMVRAAKAGARLLMEKSAGDGFAAARASKREDEFRDDMRAVEAAWQERIAKHRQR